MDDTAAIETAAIETILSQSPRPPAAIGRFSANVLFGQPGIYPDGPVMEPARGRRHADASIELSMTELVGTAGEAVLDAWNAGRTTVVRFAYGESESPGRIVGPPRTAAPIADVALIAGGAMRVVNERYQAEDPRLLLPSIVHDLLWSGPDAGHAEETLLHALGAYVHAQLLARDPLLGALDTELARRQNSITIALLNSRQPGSPTITLVAADGPGTIPGGAPGMQTVDFWSVPFGPLEHDGAAIGAVVRETLARVAAVDLAVVPSSYDDALGEWCSERLLHVLTPAEQFTANQALGLLP